MTVDHAVVVGQVHGNEAGVEQLVGLTIGGAIEVVMAVDVAVHARGDHEGITANTALIDNDVVYPVSDLMETAEQGLRLVVVVGAPDNVAGLDECQRILYGAFFGFVDLFVIFVCHSANLFPGDSPNFRSPKKELRQIQFNSPIIQISGTFFNREVLLKSGEMPGRVLCRFYNEGAKQRQHM
jgi:hypothetical protein